MYELQKQADVEPGAIRLVAKHLEEGGLLQRSEQGDRRRREISITERGAEVLESRWRDCLKPHADAESVFRSAVVALLVAGPGEAANYLETVADQHQWGYTRTRKKPKMSEPPVTWYAYMRSQWEIERRKAAAELFRSMARELKEETKM